MSISYTKVNDGHQRLMIAIGDAIRTQTALSPIPVDEIIGVLGFTLGAAIARGANGRNSRRQLREIAVANVDSGLQATTQSMASSSLILPNGVQ
jgi:hypothetical protein